MHLPLIKLPFPSTLSKKLDNCSPRLIFRCNDENDKAGSLLFERAADVISELDSEGLAYPMYRRICKLWIPRFEDQN